MANDNSTNNVIQLPVRDNGEGEKPSPTISWMEQWIRNSALRKEREEKEREKRNRKVTHDMGIRPRRPGSGGSGNGGSAGGPTPGYT